MHIPQFAPAKKSRPRGSQGEIRVEEKRKKGNVFYLKNGGRRKIGVVEGKTGKKKKTPVLSVNFTLGTERYGPRKLGWGNRVARKTKKKRARGILTGTNGEGGRYGGDEKLMVGI